MTGPGRLMIDRGGGHCPRPEASETGNSGVLPELKNANNLGYMAQEGSAILVCVVYKGKGYHSIIL